MTPLQVHEAILTTVGEPEGIFHTRTNILPLVQHAELLLGLARGVTEKTAVLPLVYNQAQYRIHATVPDFVFPLRINVLRKQLRPTTHSRIADLDTRWTTTVGTPEFYFMIGATRLGFYPTAPSSTLSAIVTYAALPVVAGDSQVYLAGAEWHEAMVHYVSAMLLAKEQKYQEATLQLNLFLAKIGMDRDPRFTIGQIKGPQANMPISPPIQPEVG